MTYYAQIGLLFFYSCFWGFFSMFEAIFIFPAERKMLPKERSSGTYKLSSYYMSMMVSVLSIGLVLPTIFNIITYWMTGLKPTAGGFYFQHVPPFVSWIKYISISQYSYKLLLRSQFDHDETYPCDSGKLCLVGEYPSIKMVGLGGQVTSAVAVIIMIVGFRVVSYLALMRVGVIRK